jgi:Ca2+:H+ antiporter
VSAHSPSNPWWSIAFPVLGVATLAATWGRDVPTWVMVIVALSTGLNVLTAVHHAEVIAAKVGEPFGSLTLALAVTVIEVALILTIMLGGGEDAATLARDTAFAAVMIIYTGLVGTCLLIGTIKHHVQAFHPRGAAGALGATTVLVTVTLVLPSFTRSSEGPTLTTSQLLFFAFIALCLYGTFVVFQTSRHRNYFVPEQDEDSADVVAPTNRTTLVSLLMLLLCLVDVVGLTKVLSPTLKDAVASAGAPTSSVGVIIALLVLAPETLAAVRAAAANQLQTSMNLAFGSAMASIGLTIPAIAVASLFTDLELQLGLSGSEIVLMALTVVTTILTVLPGRVTVMQGAIHLSIFATFLFLAISP